MTKLEQDVLLDFHQTEGFRDVEDFLANTSLLTLEVLCRERGERLAADHSAAEILHLIAEVIDDPGIPACNYNDVIRVWKRSHEKLTDETE